jgi:hypothetical protein
MNLKRSAAMVVIVAACALSAFGKDKNQGTFTLLKSTTVGSTELKPGDYKFEFDGTGSPVQVKFLRGKDVVATANASVMESSLRQQGVAVTTRETGNTRIIEQIDFGKRTLTLASGEAAVQGQ